PSKITAQRSDSIAPSMAILKATGTKAVSTSNDHKASPPGVSHNQGNLKEGRKGGIPWPVLPSGNKNVKRLPMVSTVWPYLPKISDATTPMTTAGRWPGTGVRKRGHRISTANVTAPVISVGQLS